VPPLDVPCTCCELARIAGCHTAGCRVEDFYWYATFYSVDRRMEDENASRSCSGNGHWLEIATDEGDCDVGENARSWICRWLNRSLRCFWVLS
jgi:hypothetical protein